MRERRLAGLAVLALFLLVLAVVIVESAEGDDPPPPTYQGLTIEQWAAAATVAASDRDAARSKLARRERQLRRARQLVKRLRLGLRARVSLAGPGAGTRGLLCIHQFERGSAGWATNTGNGYYGGLQFDRSFQRTYGRAFYAELGTADRWPAYVQLAVGLAGYLDRGFGPWPLTRRACGV